MTERDERIAWLLGVRGHAEGCPGEDDPAAARLEAFELERPVVERVHDPELGDWRETVVRRDTASVCRCLECGGQKVFEQPLEGLLEGAAR